MKILNKIILPIFTTLSIILLISCEADEKHRFPASIANGGFMKFSELPEFNMGSDPSTASFSALIEDTNNNVALYEVKVRGYFNGATTDTIAFKSTSTFDFDAGFTTSDMATLFSVEESVFEAGDKFDFVGKATTNNGLVYDGTQTGCECPQDPIDPEDPDATAGEWNEGTTNDVLLTARTLLQAYNWTVTFADPE